MRLVKSICTNLVFPASRKDIAAFRDMAAYLKSKGIGCIEFYHDGDGRAQTGTVLADLGLDGVYIGVIPSKEGAQFLCNTDETARRAAVDVHTACLDEMRDNGLTQFMICSGKLGPDVDAQLRALETSVEELYTYAAAKNIPVRILLEPCDSNMDARHLLGPTGRCVAFVEAMRARGFPLELTMDTAHVAEEGEDFLDAMRATRPYCTHVHFANCLVTDPANPFYGDKHLGFEYPDTVWSPAALADVFAGLEALYPGENDLRVALEVLCREDDPYAYFEKMWASLPFLSEHP